MKKVYIAVLALICLLTMLASCSKKPQGEITTTEVVASHIDEYQVAIDGKETTKASNEAAASEAVAGAESDDYDITKDPHYINFYDMQYANHNVYNKSCGAIKGFRFEDYGIGKVRCYVTILLEGIGVGEKEFKIGYRELAEDGTLIRQSYLRVPIKDSGIKEGDTFEARMDIDNTQMDVARVEFFDYVK